MQFIHVTVPMLGNAVVYGVLLWILGVAAVRIVAKIVKWLPFF